MLGHASKPFAEGIKTGVALNLQVYNSTADGSNIEHPAKHGRILTFVAQIGAVSSMSALKIKLQGTNDDLSGSPTWADVQDVDSNDLQFTQASMLVANTVVIGSVDVTRLPYKHFRLSIETLTGTSIGLGITYIISHLRSFPSVTTDDLYYKMHGSGVGAL